MLEPNEHIAANWSRPLPRPIIIMHARDEAYRLDFDFGL
jgi:hypothetical protein